MAVRSLLAVSFAALLLGGCGSLSGKSDETAGWSAERIYAEAKETLNDGSYEKAIKLYEKLEARYPFGVYAQQAQLDTAYAYYKQDESAAAVVAADRFIRLHPRHPSTPYAWYLKGLANFKGELGILGNISQQDMTERDPQAAAESFAAFKELVTSYPDSQYTPDATQRMKFLVNAIAQHEINVADFYYRRGAYVAAVNRAQRTILEYPNAPANEKGLFIAMKAYDALGMTDLRDDVQRVMKKNFPTSEYYAKGLSGKDPWWKLW